MAARRREVRWSKAAAGDLWSIVEFIARDRPLVAEEILGRIQKRASSLSLAADRGRRVPELERQGIREYREFLVSVWRVVYRVSTGSVDVLMVIDSRRNIEDVLLMRLARRD